MSVKLVPTTAVEGMATVATRPVESTLTGALVGSDEVHAGRGCAGLRTLPAGCGVAVNTGENPGAMGCMVVS